jgi:hypothetical protein
MARLDLNAARAARSEAENAPHEVVLGYDKDGAEQVFTLPPRAPLEFLDHLPKLEFAEAMQVLLGGQQAWERFAAAGAELDDLLAIAADLYGIGDLLGEASASRASSPNGGRPSKPTGAPTTAATSRRTATAKARSGSASSSP